MFCNIIGKEDEEPEKLAACSAITNVFIFHEIQKQ